MGRFSDASANAMLDTLFGSGTPATHYFGLSTTAPNNDGTGVTEPVAGGYARAAVPNTSGTWPAATSRYKQNATAIFWPAATADWGAIAWFVIYDAATNGNMIAWGDLLAAQNIVAGVAPSFQVNGLSISFPG